MTDKALSEIIIAVRIKVVANSMMRFNAPSFIARTARQLFDYVGIIPISVQNTTWVA